jgi:osmotically-inducible protein OsmY
MANLLLRGLLAMGLMTAVAVPTVEAKTTGSSSSQASSATIEKQVSKRIRSDRRLAKQDINVSVDESGEAKLTGTVSSKTAKDRAGEIAGAVKGVTQVDNQLDVRSKSAPSEEQGASEDRGQQGKTQQEQKQQPAQGKAEQGAQGAKETMSDSWITTKLKSQLITAEPEASNVSVETNNGIVTLSGTVGSAAIRDRTLEIARNTDGVRDVVDKLKVVAPKANPAQ